jgi:hypothetical protein
MEVVVIKEASVNAEAVAAPVDNTDFREPIRVFLQLPPRTSAKGLRYSVRLGSPHGELLVQDSLVPFCDAARVLLGRGVRGKTELWDAERPFPRMRGLIEELARLTVREDERTGPQFVLWRPFPAARERSKTADRSPKVSKHPKVDTAVGGSEINP